MAIAVGCDRCGDELTAPGGLMFSPPLGAGWIVQKYHLCVLCFRDVLAFVGSVDVEIVAGDA